MDLYSFITDNVPKAFQKDQAPKEQASEAAGAMQPRQPLDAEAFVAVNEDLLNRINALEKQVETLKNDLGALLRANASDEATDMMTEKFSELERLKSDIVLLQQESREALFRIQNIEKGSQRSIDETEKLGKDCTAFKKETQRALVIACAVTALVIAGLFIYFSSRTVSRQNQDSKQVSAGTISVSDYAVVAAWPRNPIALNVGDFRISLSPLESGAANKLAAETSDTTTNTHSFYNLEIRAKRGVISPAFLKAPAIDFINKDGTHAKSDAGPGLSVMHVSMSGKRPLKKGTGLFRCVVSLKKEFQPVGILIGGLNKRTRMIAIYA